MTRRREQFYNLLAILFLIAATCFAASFLYQSFRKGKESGPKISNCTEAYAYVSAMTVYWNAILYAYCKESEPTPAPHKSPTQWLPIPPIQSPARALDLDPDSGRVLLPTCHISATGVMP